MFSVRICLLVFCLCPTFLFSQSFELGSGVRDGGVFLAPCFKGPVEYFGGQMGVLASSLDGTVFEVETQAHARTTGRIGFSFAHIGGDVSFQMKKITEENVYQFTFSYVYSSKWQSLVDFEPTVKGRKVLSEISNASRSRFWEHSIFREACGDKLVHAILSGFRFDVFVRLYVKHDSFVSHEEAKKIVKVLFVKKSSVSQRRRAEYLKVEKIEVSGRQIGGIQVDTSSDLARIRICSIENFDDCRERVVALMEHLNDSGSEGFISKARNNLGVLDLGYLYYADLKYMGAYIFDK